MKQELQEDWKQEIALLLLKEQHEALVAFLNEHALIKKRLGRKLEKLLEKQKRKQEKKADKAVSYTHLDVYKRQPFIRGQSIS